METPVRIRLAGLVAGAALGTLVTLTPARFAPLGPLLFAGLTCLGVLAAEVTLPRPERGRSTSASLEVRRVRDYVAPRAVHRLLGWAVAYLLLSLLIGVGWAEAETFAGVGYGGIGGAMVSAAVTVPVALALGYLLLRQVVRSPRAGAELRGGDDAWRRRAATTIVATLGVLTTGMTAGLAFAGAALFAQDSSARPAIAAFDVVAGVAVIALYRYAVMLLAPADPAPDRPAQAAEAPELSLTNQ